MRTRNSTGDRLVATRANNHWQTFHMKTKEAQEATGDGAEKDRRLYCAVLENEVLKSNLENLDDLQLANKKRRVLSVRFVTFP